MPRQTPELQRPREETFGFEQSQLQRGRLYAGTCQQDWGPGGDRVGAGGSFVVRVVGLEMALGCGY